MLSDNAWNNSLASSDTDVYVPKAIICHADVSQKHPVKFYQFIRLWHHPIQVYMPSEQSNTDVSQTHLAKHNRRTCTPQSNQCRCLIKTSLEILLIYTSLASPNTGVYVFRATKCKTKLTYRLYVSGTIRTRYISGYIFAKIIIESGQMHLQIHYIK